MIDKGVMEFLRTRFRTDLDKEFNDMVKSILKQLEEPQELEKERLLNVLKDDLIGTMENIQGFRIFEEV
ncbi:MULTISPECIES: hypothetical protein [unclassified Clostridium]|uniref:hypothetical protein n=1 Tax=unclassified Clostridium TaxID=2614128 RepID=UPI0025C1FA18|nr:MULTISPECIES: hypothetical protein [unclassified Clostridium]